LSPQVHAENDNEVEDGKDSAITSARVFVPTGVGPFPSSNCKHDDATLVPVPVSRCFGLKGAAMISDLEESSGGRVNASGEVEDREEEEGDASMCSGGVVVMKA
jgi:hypothetical protein